ncbi:GDSL esterase/lipase 7-like [Papaver somniferum]|uniref:GDSL esterase/lipase 7-like n=1 Tax=Papaver somniferum TaxID=3469 RepID=UPI000E6F9A41|nr:GDSL esterase/lipase 7-like [Papaver somniferum]
MEDVNDLVLEYNALLSERFLDLNFEFPDALIIFCDMYQAMMDIISFPSRYANKMGLPRIPAFHADNGTIEGLENGINFGSTQAAILSSGRLGFQGLNQQLRQAYETLQLLQLQLGQDKAQEVIESSVFYLSLGKDDYINFLHPDSSGVGHRFSKEAFTQILVNQMIQVIKDLYNANVKKIVCMGIGPLGCVWESSHDNDSHHPSLTSSNSGAGSGWKDYGRCQYGLRRAIDPCLVGLPLTSSNSGAGSGWQDCMEDVNDLVLEYNALLSERFLDLNFEFPDALIIFCDMYQAMMDIISFPSRYGFENVNRSCCGTGRYGGMVGCQAIEMAFDEPLTHVWWDFHNPTQAVHSLLAESAWSSKPLDICRPISIERLSVSYSV